MGCRCHGETNGLTKACNERQAQVDDAMRDVDILIADSTYTSDEYHQGKVGWGHGTFEHSIEMARRVGALVLSPLPLNRATLYGPLLMGLTFTPN
jgi:hypothetical protein